jgi:formamidopyrimidine-DNA glycosylase
MPELPEVETVANGLRKTILNKTVKSVTVRSPKINQDNHRGWTRKLIGRKPRDIRRRGKNILIDFTGDLTLWIHLKMTGHFYYLPRTRQLDKHDHMIIDFKGDKYNLRFNDYRKFGRVRLCPTDKVMFQKGLVDLGPEPTALLPNEFARLLKSSRRMIKPALLDQTFIAGLGNIYTDESLFAAKIHPRRLTDSISHRKAIELISAIKDILKKAIRNMGTSVDSFAGLDGQPGGFQKYLAVYGKRCIRCTNCDGRIRHEKIGSRTAHYCPRCQRLR